MPLEQAGDHARAKFDIEIRFLEFADRGAIGEARSIDALKCGGDAIARHDLH